MRSDRRQNDQLRPVRITRRFTKFAPGSVLIETGDTKVICTASVKDEVPAFLEKSGRGWITAEYGMLPGSTPQRKDREASRGKVEGRTQEIQRLIGRSMRAVVDLSALVGRTIWIDCDVIQADGGTRTASITGAYVALVDALRWLNQKHHIFTQLPTTGSVAAVSVGLIDSVPMLDLCYSEDFAAQVDMNVVMTDQGEFIEVQGTGEESTFTESQLQEMLALAKKGIAELIAIQRSVLEAT